MVVVVECEILKSYIIFEEDLLAMDFDISWERN